jgi:hypothetical protein
LGVLQFHPTASGVPQHRSRTSMTMIRTTAE